MDVKSVQAILQTRLAAAEQEGNHTEKSFLYELWKMSEELRKECEK